jgi:two-component system, chemotaxis family, response regulator Rcp1
MEAATPERLILLIEDRVDDPAQPLPERANSIASAIESSQHRVISLHDGLQAIDFLHQRGEYSDSPRPDLILLELNLPGKDGREILAEIKASHQLRRIPIVVLTTADSEADIFNTYALQGNCHVVKSTDLDRLCQIVHRIEEFWFGIVTLPVS